MLDIDSDFATLVAAVLAAAGSAFGVWYAASRQSKTQAAQIVNDQERLENERTAMINAALKDVYAISEQSRSQLKEELKEARVRLGEQGKRLGTIEIEMAHLKGAHELLLRLQCPLAADGTCPVFQARPPPPIAVAAAP